MPPNIPHLRQTLWQNPCSGLSLNVAKCEWAMQETNYLGYQLGNGELQPQACKVQAIRDSPRPRMKKVVLHLTSWVLWAGTTGSPLTLPQLQHHWRTYYRKQERTQWNGPRPAKMCSAPVLQSPDFTRRLLVQCLAIKWVLEALRYYLLGLWPGDQPSGTNLGTFHERPQRSSDPVVLGSPALQIPNPALPRE